MRRKRRSKARPLADLDQALRIRRRKQQTIAWSEPNAREQALLLNGFGHVVGEIGRNYYGTWRGWVLRNFAMEFLGEYPGRWEAARAVEQAYLEAAKEAK